MEADISWVTVGLSVVGIGVVIGAMLVLGVFPFNDVGAYAHGTVTVTDNESGSELADITVRFAESRQQRYIGLSETESLSDGEGMLFVHPSEGTQDYVMRDMAFPLDIVFIDSEGHITTIHHARVESDDDLKRYSGQAKWVLEVPRGYTNRTGISVGDTVTISRNTSN